MARFGKAARPALVSAAAMALAALLLARGATADPVTTATPPRAADSSTATTPPGEFPPWFIPEGEPMKTLALEANPLGLAIGMFSANLEYVFSTHHAIVISPHYYFAIPGATDVLTGGGVELGYRYYTGIHGPEGWFLGGAFTYGSYEYVHHVAVDAAGNTPSDTSYDAIGGAVDGGYQILLAGHTVLGAGVGVLYRYFDLQPSYDPLQHTRQELIYGSGIRPRFLVSFGGAL